MYNFNRFYLKYLSLFIFNVVIMAFPKAETCSQQQNW